MTRFMIAIFQILLYALVRILQLTSAFWYGAERLGAALVWPISRLR